MEIKDSPLKESGEIKIGSYSAPILSPSTLSLSNTDLENSFRLKYRLFGKENYDVITEIITGNVRDKDLLTSITPRAPDYGRSDGRNRENAWILWSFYDST
mgnify:CR=1 FL=1